MCILDARSEGQPGPSSSGTIARTSTSYPLKEERP